MNKMKLQIIDIRLKNKYMEGHIPNSINILENVLLLYPERFLDKNNSYVLYCDHGSRSKRVSDYLNKNGYKTYSLIGGYSNYKNMLR